MTMRITLVVNIPLPNGDCNTLAAAHRRQPTSELLPRGIYAEPVSQTCMGLYTHGTHETRTRSDGNPAPVPTGTGFCRYGCGWANFSPRVTRAHHYLEEQYIPKYVQGSVVHHSCV